MFGHKLFDALKDVEGVDLEDLQRMRDLGNALSGPRNTWARSDGTIDPNFFSRFGPGGGFTILPHECASLKFNSQSIDNNSLTTPATDGNSAATWNNGMKIDVANSKILFAGIPGESIVAAFSWWQWAANATNQRELTLNTTGGGSTHDRREAYTRGGIGTYNFAFNIRRMAAGESDFNIQVYQNSGGGLNGDGLLVVLRIR